MIINCGIIDDEPMAMEVIKNHLKDIPNIDLKYTWENPIPALETINNGGVDVVFIDINMPIMNGLDFIRSIKSGPQFVITTAYREFAAESYDLDVLDYLVKPIPFNRFLKTVQKIKSKFSSDLKPEPDNESDKSYIFLKVDKKYVKIKFDEIYYIESLKDYIKVFTKTGNYLVHKTMASLEEELPSNNFLRIHRSYLISISEVEFIEGNSIQINKKRIPMGRKYVETAKGILLNME